MSKVFIQESTLTAIGDAIRTQTGGTDLIAPGDMPIEILAIEGGGTGGGGYEPTDEELTLTGDCQYRFANRAWDWVIREYGDRITSNNISGIQYMFSNSDIEEIPFDINCSGSNIYIAYAFSGCYDLRSAGKITGVSPANGAQLFYSCHNLRELPVMENWNWSSMHTTSYQSLSTMFANCYSLRSFPEDWLKEVYNAYTSSYGSQYNQMFYFCVSLDELRSVPVGRAAYTSNVFQGTFDCVYRVKDIIFDTNNGTPYEVAWKNQTIDLARWVGYAYFSSSDYIYNYNSGITTDKQVTDAASYAALKDDPDWYTEDLAYSRYNKQSAIRTLQSLPTTTGTGCTIKFKENQGSGISGGRIGAMSESDIAAAAAKGWTVTFVE